MVGRNEVIIAAGTPATTMYFVDEGSVKVVERLAKDGGDDVILGSVKEGGFFGEEALIAENQKVENTFVAMEPTVLLSINKESLQHIMVESMGVGTKLLLGLSKTYREALAIPEKMAQVITFYAPKGGNGATTLAVNFACRLAQTGKKVAFIDCDLQFGNANLFIGANANLNIARIIQRENSLVYDRVKHYLDRKFDVDFLHSPHQPQESELVSRSNLNQILQVLTKKYDYLILDSLNEINDQTLLLWDAADRIVLVSQPDLTGITRLFRLFKVLSRLNYPQQKFIIAANRCRNRCEEGIEQLKKLPVEHLFKISEDEIAAHEALIEGVPINIKFPESIFSKEIDKMVSAISGESATPADQKGGIFSRIKSLFG